MVIRNIQAFKETPPVDYIALRCLWEPLKKERLIGEQTYLCQLCG